MRPAKLEPNDVLTRALSGEDRIAVEALDVFVTWLGRFAGDAALLFGARGGVYLGGGIAPKIAHSAFEWRIPRGLRAERPHDSLSRADPRLRDPCRLRDP